MNTPTPSTRGIELDRAKATVEAILDDFLTAKARSAEQPEAERFGSVLSGLLDAGGKRLRPLLCVIGWHTATDAQEPPALWHLAASLELFHAFTLIHDDVMDRSATRRGRPTAHRVLAAHYAGCGQARARDWFGTSGAILLGDLALVWSDELLHRGHPTPRQLTAVLPLLNAMRTEVMYGQYLDLLTTGRTPDLPTALTVIRYKTAKYTIERPLQLGAALAAAPPPLLAACTAYALPLGEAFQLRDDLLGVFGHPHHTGKSTLDDLREGKATALAALALERAGPRDRTRLEQLLGDRTLTEEGAAEARRIILDTGAKHTVEQMIDDRFRQAMTALHRARLPHDAVQALSAVAEAAVYRAS
ncbi:polyprenyl synthetase family protein [Streptomyces mobaraensis]|uniref:Polyprenyl synthetase family protein n=1 Tax=Streptomyces mobaraensis TaxID=35621 RepID=A0A5N5WA13_STRMB|nr:polyprenyl synthetase family protein [Streptomyces mobaraensis]KAB7846082.1 polyprenyl synthetase family protein [Streptomyces mobaraensis]